MKIHLPRQAATRPTIEPGRPHAFVQVNDPGLGAAAVAGGNLTNAMGTNAAVIVTDNYLRKRRCGVPGCGRDRSDEIHVAPEG